MANNVILNWSMKIRSSQPPFLVLVLLLLSATRWIHATLYVPGDAMWLGNYETEDENLRPPPIDEYLPFTYTIIGDESVVIPRILVRPEHDCPQLALTHFVNVEGAEDPVIPAVVTRAVGNSILPYAFPIRVCEARIKEQVYQTAWSDEILQYDLSNYTTDRSDYVRLSTNPFRFRSRGNVRLTKNPSKFLLIGDTGLRVKPSDLGLGECSSTESKLYGVSQCDKNFTQADLDRSLVSGIYQPLTGEGGWTLETLQEFAALENPDLVVWMGDYLYRQGPCPDGSDVSCVDINGPPYFSVDDLNGTAANFLPGYWGDNLYGWWADFFYPSRFLMQTSPLLAIRGNHENCDRAGHGYFLFLAQEEYPPEMLAGHHCTGYSHPYAVPFDNEQFLVMDDSLIDPLNGGFDHFDYVKDACPGPPGPGEAPIVAETQSRFENQEEGEVLEQIAYYTAYMEQLELFSQSHDTNFYTSHRPLFAVACNNETMVTLDWTMQESLGVNTLNRVVAAIGGHMHWLEAIQFVNDSLPVQLVVGNGGTKLIDNYVVQEALPGMQLKVGRKEQQYQGTIRKGITSSDMFGYALMSRNDETGNYDVIFRGLNQSTLSMVDFDFSLTIPKGPRVPAYSPDKNGLSKSSVTSSSSTGSFWILEPRMTRLFGMWTSTITITLFFLGGILSISM